jgi:hypothetical protein
MKQLEQWEKEKAEVLRQMNEAIQLYDDNGAGTQLIETLLRIKGSAATANAKEWKKEGYYSWWIKHRPAVFAPERENLQKREKSEWRK